MRIRFSGQAPIQGTVWELERLECSLCERSFTADAPDEVGDEKYDASVTAVLAVLKYGRGIPFNRIEAIQTQAGIPLPASTQWEILEEDAALVRPVQDELTRQAAQAAVLHGDDTKVRLPDVGDPLLLRCPCVYAPQFRRFGNWGDSQDWVRGRLSGWT